MELKGNDMEHKDAHAQEHHHESSYGSYFLIWFALLGLTGLTVAAAGLDLGYLGSLTATVQKDGSEFTVEQLNVYAENMNKNLLPEYLQTQIKSQILEKRLFNGSAEKIEITEAKVQPETKALAGIKWVATLTVEVTPKNASETTKSTEEHVHLSLKKDDHKLKVYQAATMNVIVALLIAIIKTTLVLMFFMHLKHEHRLFAFMVIGTLAIFCVVIGLTFADTWYRPAP